MKALNWLKEQGVDPSKVKPNGKYTVFLNGHSDASWFKAIEKAVGKIEHNDIDMVIFLRDPQNPKSHEPDINNIFMLCDMHNIPLATNLATAELMVKALDRGDLDWREMFK